MNWQLDINSLITILGIAAVAGMGWMRLTMIEQDVERIEKEVIDNRHLFTDMAVVKTQLININVTLDKMTKLIERFERQYEEDNE